MNRQSNSLERFERAFGPNQAAHKCRMISMTHDYLQIQKASLSSQMGLSLARWQSVHMRIVQTFGAVAMQELMSEVFCQLDIIKMLAEIDFAEPSFDNMVYVLNVEEGQAFETADNVVKFETATA